MSKAKTAKFRDCSDGPEILPKKNFWQTIYVLQVCYNNTKLSLVQNGFKLLGKALAGLARMIIYKADIDPALLSIIS